MRSFFTYLKSPVEDFKLTKKSLLSVLLIALVLFCLNAVVSYWVDTPQSSVTHEKISQYPLWFVLVVPPLLEELAFRLWMRRKAVTLFISSTCFVWLFVSLALSSSVYSSEMLLFRCVISLLTGGIVTLLLKNMIETLPFPALFYFSALAFGFLHLFNYSGIGSAGALIGLIIIMLLKSFSGLFLGYVRMGYGFYACFLFHFLNNLFPMLYKFFIA